MWGKEKWPGAAFFVETSVLLGQSGHGPNIGLYEGDATTQKDRISYCYYIDTHALFVSIVFKISTV